MALDIGNMGGEQIGGLLTRMANNGSMLNQQLGNLIQALTDILPFAGGTGTFTCGAAVATTVSNTSVAANSIILLMPTNAAAGTLQGSTKSLYISARTVGVSFAVSTASAVAAAGTETFGYLLINPSA